MPNSPSIFTEAQQEEIRGIVRTEIKDAVHEALVEFFTKSGKIGRNIIVTTAILVTSLIAIGSGFKMMLAAFGIGYISK